MDYTINVRRDGQHNDTQIGITGTKRDVIENLFERRSLSDLTYEEQDAMRADLMDRGYTRYDIYTYTLTPLPYSECSITPAPGGFGQYEAGFGGEFWAHEGDLLAAMREDATILELGVDELPDGVEDIRGHIRNEPERVFAVMDDDGERVAYVGIRRDSEAA